MRGWIYGRHGGPEKGRLSHYRAGGVLKKPIDEAADAATGGAAAAVRGLKMFKTSL